MQATEKKAVTREYGRSDAKGAVLGGEYRRPPCPPRPERFGPRPGATGWSVALILLVACAPSQMRPGGSASGTGGRLGAGDGGTGTAGTPTGGTAVGGTGEGGGTGAAGSGADAAGSGGKGTGASGTGGTGAAGIAGSGGAAGASAAAGSTGTGGAGPVDGSADGARDPFAADVTPAKSGDLWRWTFANTVFEVNAAEGAAVTTWSLGGHNVLADGSRFRPSPQKTWNWPPPPEIAQSPYTASVAGKIVEMDSQTSAEWHVKATKRFWASAVNQVVTIEYTLTNTAAGPASWAPWEVSRVNPTGLTFFPEGNPIAPKPASYGQLLSLQTVGGVSWLTYNAASYSSGNYIVAHDALEGWSAHAEFGVLFIKSVTDVPTAQIPPEEGEVQLWTDNTHVALEFENEGAYTTLGGGQSIVWTMRWYLRAIPGDIVASVGNGKLVDFARSQLLR